MRTGYQIVLLVSTTLCLASAKARADGWVPVLIEHPDSDRTLSTVRQVFAALATEQSVSVLDPAAAARRFEQLHSAEPIEMPSEELERLGEAVQMAIRDGALGHWEAADEKVRAFNDLSQAAQDYVKLQLKLADDVLLFCLKSVDAKLAAGRQDAAREQMGRCIFASPTERPRPSDHDAAVLELYDAVRAELLGSELSTLSVDIDSLTTEGCTASVNGSPARPVPYREEGLLPTAVRVQVSCPEDGRIHFLKLEPGDNALVVDRRFEAAVHTKGVLSLRYRDAAEAHSWQVPDAARIGALFSTRTVVLMRREDDGRISLVRVDGDAQTASVGLRPGASDAEVREAARWLAAGTSREIAPPPTALARDESQLRARTGTELAVGTTLAVVGAASLTGSWLYYRRRHQHLDYFVEAERAASFARYEDMGTLALATATAGVVAGGLAVATLLPEERGVPAWSWILGGLGVGVVTTGVVLWTEGGRCKNVGCDPDARDQTLGQLIALHGVPLLSFPLTHGIRALTGDHDLEASAEHAAGTTTVSIRTTF